MICDLKQSPLAKMLVLSRDAVSLNFKILFFQSVNRLDHFFALMEKSFSTLLFPLRDCFINHGSDNYYIIQAYASLGAGELPILDDPVVVKIAAKHQLTPAHILLR